MERRTGLALALALVGALCALGPGVVLFDFTVDDALISARYAAHVAAGVGYRFNAAGPSTDGVTPLGWPFALAPFASAGPLAALRAAKWMGLVAWTAAAALLGVAILRIEGRRIRFAALALVGASAPLAAWSVAGMETGVTIALASLSAALVSLDRPRAAAACAGLCAAIRPEMLPWALVISVFGGDFRGVRGAAARLVLGAAPFALVVLTRVVVFGRPVPLAALAKPADAALGAKYALACALLTGPLAIVAPFVWARLARPARALVAAACVHFIAIALAGGDWMPLSRLAAPVLPTVVLAAAHIAALSDPRWTALRMALALAGELFQMGRVGPSAARVGPERLAIIEMLREPLREARVVAALDVGFIGAATGATIVDLAGLTDPSIAALPGGHTSKRIPLGLLSSRGVDTIVLLLREGGPVASPWTASRFSRAVEQRIAAMPEIERSFRVVAEGRTPHLAYIVLRRA